MEFQKVGEVVEEWERRNMLSKWELAIWQSEIQQQSRLNKKFKQ